MRIPVLLTALLALTAAPATAAEPFTFDLTEMHEIAWPFRSRIEWRGDSVRLMLTDGSVVTIEDEKQCANQHENGQDQPLDFERCRTHDIIGYSEEVGFALLSVQLYEGSRWLLVSLTNGSRAELRGLPIFSPDRDWFVTTPPDYSETSNFNGYEVWRIEDGRAIGPEIRREDNEYGFIYQVRNFTDNQTAELQAILDHSAQFILDSEAHGEQIARQKMKAKLTISRRDGRLDVVASPSDEIRIAPQPR